ncbi:hypothetical protein LMH87_007365 [Akanthomyces muscarius]|uniref:Nephrocystin 3-like N-terminal domain-containing protein n=1 Tax=Akanthomyces muscarius TaxID=2231603 RepID=A0A9W8UTQ0_AKAMU|nr:hypothetical protein LMH87_007365 [Akanthomyces muscarius]KAJ4165745.1 hypothetical protein LMH87_007365 [Akanthomyces muscarius]
MFCTMASPGESDGCLSILSSCFKKSRKGLPAAPNSTSQTVAIAPSAPTATQSSTQNRTPDKLPTSSNHLAKAPASSPAGSHVSPSQRVEHAPTSHSTDDQKSNTIDSPTKTVSLWQEAYGKVDPKTRTWIDEALSDTAAGDPTKELVDLVRRAEETHLEKTLKLKVGDREVLWRDYTNRVISAVTAIGDIAVNFAPPPSATFWSAVRVLLKANVTQCEDLVAIMGCTDMVLCIVRRGRVYEEVYFSGASQSADQEGLQQTLIKAYKSCLEFLALVDESLRKGHLGRFFVALVKPGQGEGRVAEVRSLEEYIWLAAQTCDAKAGFEHQKLLRSLERPLKRVDDGVLAVLTTLEKNERKRAMKYISEVPVGAHHNDKMEKRTEGTCEWLVSHDDFHQWEESACSSVLWLQGNIGTGKSFLSSKVIDRYLDGDQTTNHSHGDHDEGFAFFYCDRGDPTRRSFRYILRSYIRQLSEIPRRPDKVHEASYSLYNKMTQIQNDISMKECEIALLQMINSYPRTTLVLDALDEYK